VFADERFRELIGRSREAVDGTTGGKLYAWADELVDAGVGCIIEEVEGAYPDSTVVSSRERDGEVPADQRPEGILDALTGRQREVLEAAYRAGYYDWPRESTAEEVAASMDLTRPTLHGHLRKAERALLSRLLDDRE